MTVPVSELLYFSRAVIFVAYGAIIPNHLLHYRSLFTKKTNVSDVMPALLHVAIKTIRLSMGIIKLVFQNVLPVANVPEFAHAML